MVICEGGIGESKVNFNSLLQQSMREDGGKSIVTSHDRDGTPSADVSFSLYPNSTDSPIFGAGSAINYSSYFHKDRYRTANVAYNIESGVYAAMNMMDKRVYMKNLPMTHLQIGNTAINYVGEREPSFNEVVVNGNPESGQFVAYFVFGEEVIGFMTFGY